MEKDLNNHFTSRILKDSDDSLFKKKEPSKSTKEIIKIPNSDENKDENLNEETKDLNKINSASIEVPVTFKSLEQSLKEKAEEKKRRDTNFRFFDYETLFCISVDGSEHSENAFDIITKEFLSNIIHSKILIMHIYSSQLDSNYNHRNKKDTVIEKYETAAIALGNNAHCIWEDRAKNIHALDQVNRTAFNHKADFLVVGYFGIKGPKSENKELTKGIDYLLASSRVPVILIKDPSLREIKKNKGYNWLFVFDRAYVDCFNIIKTFLKLVDVKLDKVSGLTLLPPYVNYDDVKNKFLSVMEEAKIVDYDYSTEEYKKQASLAVNEKVNFGEVLYNFVVIFNKPEKHKVEAEKSDIPNIVLKSNANICFLNSS